MTMSELFEEYEHLDKIKIVCEKEYEGDTYEIASVTEPMSENHPLSFIDLPVEKWIFNELEVLDDKLRHATEGFNEQEQIIREALCE